MKRIFALMVSGTFFLSTPIAAEREAMLKYVTYDDNNDATVTTKGIDIAVDVTRTTKLTASGILDGITAASRKIPISSGLVLDGVTSATAKAQKGRAEYRNDYSIGVAQKVKTHTFSVLVDDSHEDDYSSFSYVLSWAKDFNNKNNTVSVSFSSFADKLFPYGVDWEDTKSSKSFDSSFTSVLSYRSQWRATFGYSRDEGFLSNPYHRVPVVLNARQTYYFSERNPTVHDKETAGLFYVFGFPGTHPSSVQFDYRYYQDTWDVRSHTGGIQITSRVTAWLTGSLRMRYYRQNEADFFKNSYAAEERFMTSDVKLAAFRSALYGAGLGIQIADGVYLDVLFEQYRQYSDIDYTRIVQSVSKSDLKSHIIFVGTRLKL